MNLSLVAINSRYTHSCPALYYLRSAIADLPHEVRIHEFTIHQPPIEILAEIEKHRPDIIALSIYIWNSMLFREIVPALRSILPDVKLVLGGPEVTGNPQYWQDIAGPDSHIIEGFGELAFREHIVMLSSEAYRSTDNTLGLEFSSLPFLYTDGDMQELKGRYIYYEASRGCPFNCSYCVSSKHKFEKRGLDRVLPELDWLSSHKPNIVKLVDRSFNADPDYAHAIWKHLIESNPSTRFHFEIYPSLLREKDIDLLKTAPPGLFQFEVGIQSIHDDILRGVNRHESWSKVEPILRKLIGMGNIHIHLDMICGLPLQTENHIRESFIRIYDLQPDHFQMGFLKVLPGTSIFQNESDYDCMQHPPYHILKTRWLSFRQISRLIQIARLVDLFHNSGNFSAVLERLVMRASSPYDFYDDLLAWWQKNDIPIQSATWQVLAKNLADFIGNDRESIDCLRWDWCKIANSHWFPEYLLCPEIDKRSIIEQLIDRNPEIPLQQLKRAVIFVPETEDFRSRMMPDASYACFIPTDNGKIIRYIKQ